MEVVQIGARGKLKLAGQLRAVPSDIAADTAAADVQAVAPDKPEDVKNDPALSAAWDVIVPQLDAAGLVAKSDGPAIVLALMHFVTAGQAYRQIGGDVMVECEDGVKKNPAEAVLRMESELFLKYAQQLGMTFVARARTPGQKGDADAEANPFSATGS